MIWYINIIDSLNLSSYIYILGGGATAHNGLYGEAPPKRGTFFMLQVYKRVGISQVEICKRVEKSVIEAIFKRAFNCNIIYF